MLERVEVACPACGVRVQARRLALKEAAERERVVIFSHEHPSGGSCHAGGETISIGLVATGDELASPPGEVENGVEVGPARWWIWRGFSWLAAVLVGVVLAGGAGGQAGPLAISASAVVAIGVLEAGRAWPSLVVRITGYLESDDDQDGPDDGGG